MACRQMFSYGGFAGRMSMSDVCHYRSCQRDTGFCTILTISASAVPAQMALHRLELSHSELLMSHTVVPVQIKKARHD